MGICGEVPAIYKEMTPFLVAQGTDSISVNPSSIVHTIAVMRDAELLSRGASAEAFRIVD